MFEDEFEKPPKRDKSTGRPIENYIKNREISNTELDQLSSIRSLINRRYSPREQSLAKRKVMNKKKEMLKSTVNNMESQ